MEENLKTTRYDDSTPIPLIQDSTVWGDYQKEPIAIIEIH